ncbi:MAG: hypothetical protein A3K19_12660 [Lentisphaerae bacterium RIFOXYB12_FULL_65_16]|nr:MAG: hypothetical protein A3K18_24390 [Lentisphaerae bacterium RIFOXYA12_64_32]OGV88075.1 MAG: hypothetical protein A3K19_12660 [Lentisphaerae bacterium RIFOXYB12_FULL_65_16]
MTFADLIQARLRSMGAMAHGFSIEPLAHLDYAQELALKNEALREFWTACRLPGTPAPVVAAPRPRQYRTTTRRHARYGRDGFRLAVSEDDGARPGPVGERSVLEPVEHGALYSFMEGKLSESHFRVLAEALNHVIIRGSYAERCVIFNVSGLDGKVVRKLKILGAALPEFDREVVSAFVFVDPTQSRYYLDSGQVPGSVKTKKLFGPGVLVVEFCGHRYLYYPTAFTQVNEAMVPVMLATARELLAPARDQHLVDLYCGYGLFTHFLADSYAHAWGVDSSPQGIEAAEKNARFFPPGNKVAFRVGQISGESFMRFLPRPDGHAEVLLADPPRQGMPAEVISALASRTPGKVLQACCGTDEMPRQVACWQASGYQVTKVVPLDMFAGTPHLETLLLLEPVRG